jgi:diguanylate cyclase (GGDEF)-like protein
MNNPRFGRDGLGSLFMLTSICVSVSSLLWALRLARRTASAEASALLDPLTGTFNRRGWDALIGRETARAQRSGTSMTVFVMDIDEFKLINDKYGHLRGDRVLRDVAAAIRSCARAGDVLARLGGDEFALLAVDDGSNFAETLLLRLDAALAPLGVTISVGFATAEPGSDVADAIETADGHMYCNKAVRRATRATAGSDLEALL